MTRPLRIIGLLLIALCFTSTATAKKKKKKKPTDTTPKNAWIIQQEKYEAVSAQLCKEKKWEELEVLLDDSVANPEILMSPASSFYFYIRGINTALFTGDFETRLKNLNEWEQAYPESKYIDSFKIRYWMHYAWDARGSGWAYTVTEEGWKLFRERLSNASDIFHEATAGLEVHPNPYMYYHIRSVALGQGWEHNDIFETIATPIIEHYPWYYEALNFYSPYLARWSGEPNDITDYYSKVADHLPGEYANKFYTYSFSNSSSLNMAEEVSPNHIDFDRIKQGLIEFTKAAPEDYRRMHYGMIFMNVVDQAGNHNQFYADFRNQHPDSAKAHGNWSKYLEVMG